MTGLNSLTIRRYVRAAPMPLLTALGSLLLAGPMGAAAIGHAGDGRALMALLLGLWAGGCTLAALVSLADSFSRYREYQRIRAILLRFGWHPRIIRPIARSRCQRDAACLASAEAGCLAQTRAYLRELGYRWYHLLPDLVVRSPRQALTGRFWRSVLLPRSR